MAAGSMAALTAVQVELAAGLAVHWMPGLENFPGTEIGLPALPEQLRCCL